MAGGSRRAPSPLGGSACPSSPSAPCGGARPRALRGPALASGHKVVGSRGPGSARPPFCASAGGAGSACGLLPAPSSGALARRRPVLGFPPPPRAAARGCSPRLPPPALARLRAGPLAPPAGPRPGPRWALVPAPAGPPCLAARALAWPAGRRLPARGLSARCAGLGGRVPRPRALGAVRGWLVPSIANGSTRPRQAGQRPGLDSRRLRRGVKSKGQRPDFASRGLDILHYSWYDNATDGASSVTIV